MLVIDLKIANFWNLVQVALYVILDFFFACRPLHLRYAVDESNKTRIPREGCRTFQLVCYDRVPWGIGVDNTGAFSGWCGQYWAWFLLP